LRWVNNRINVASVPSGEAMQKNRLCEAKIWQNEAKKGVATHEQLNKNCTKEVCRCDLLEWLLDID